VDIGTVVGLIIAFVAIMASMIMGGGNPASLIDMPSILVVFGGTAGAIAASFPLARLFKLHTIIFKAVFAKKTDAGETIRDLVKYAEVARREGILSLENLIPDMKDDFIVRGVKMAVDGADPELIQHILDTELEALMDRHTVGKQVIETIGRYAPAFGMIGTLMGLISMLSNMDDPSAIGPGMAVALITTLYGALIANIFAGPIADKLGIRDAEEVLIKTLIVTGVMSIQSGDNPRVVESKLMTFLPPSQRKAFEEEQQKKAA